MATPRSGPGGALAGGVWREELIQLLELLAERADRRLHPLPWALPMPLRVHGRYSRAEIEAAHCYGEACGLWRAQHRIPLDPLRRRALAPSQRHRSAVHHPAHKREALFSPSTRYRDLALGPALFHWESQSTTTAASTGQRYIHYASRGSRVLLFVREQRKQDGRAGAPTEPFVCLGFARYESHEGERILFVHQWRFAGGWSGRSRRRGCR